MKALKFICRHRSALVQGAVFFGWLLLACGVEGIVNLLPL